MNLNDYTSGSWKQQYKYKSFSPSFINHTFTWNDPMINTLLEEATRTLGKLDAYTMIVPNVDIFIKMHITKEANTSSKIEGTQTNMDEVLMSIEDIDPEKRDDWQEVQNYIRAMREAIVELENLPLSNRLIRQTHKTLLSNVRGETKMPGEFRTSQNWIGGSNLNNASYIPPHDLEVADLMGDLELFLHNEEIHVPHLIKIAIAHYQFETIHPFLDGNGRVGRLLITLYLISKGLLAKPSLYLSDFFERNKGSYYDSLTMVRASSDLTGWIKFFLTAIIETAKSGEKTFENILTLKGEMDETIISFGKKAQNASKLINMLYQNPIVTIKNVADELEITRTPASNLLTEFENKNILIELTGNQRNKVFVFFKYLKLFNSDKVE